MIAGVGLEQLFIAGPNGAILELPLDDGNAFPDLVLVDRGAVAAQQELHDIGWHRVLPAVLAHEILAHEIAIEHRCGQLV